MPKPTWNSTRISTATTTVVSSLAAVLGAIWVEGGTLGAVTVYNNSAASGTAIMTFTPNGTDVPKPAMICPEPGLGCGSGITVVTAAATNLVVFWKSQRAQ